uniref:WSC domain-containing protein n=1 Tax=Macrostomum lignano TaxID=282301 RepID=A0A1I8G2L4_9PLAT
SAQSAAAPVVKKDPPKDESTSENPDHNSNSFQAPSEANAALHITEERSTPRSQAEPDEALSAKENPLKDKDVSKKPGKTPDLKTPCACQNSSIQHVRAVPSACQNSSIQHVRTIPSACQNSSIQHVRTVPSACQNSSIQHVRTAPSACQLHSGYTCHFSAKSAAAPVIKKDPPKDESTSKNPVQSFNGIGCYLTTNKVNNEVKLELKQNIKMSHRVCALECARKSPLKRYKYFGLANGENCLCASELPRNAIKVDNPEVHCSYRCPGNHLQSCGGENAAAYFSVSTTLSSMRKGN